MKKIIVVLVLVAVALLVFLVTQGDQEVEGFADTEDFGGDDAEV